MSVVPRATVRRAAIIAVVVGAALCGRALGAWAAEPDRHGYWRQDGLGALGAPAVDVPAGGLLVSKGLADEAAVSALAVRVGGASVSAVVLVATDPAAAGGVLACPATSTWAEPDGPGSWTDRPSHDCATAAVAGVNDAGTWTFAVGDLVEAGVLDLVFVPADSVAPFSIAFEVPSVATVQVTPAPTPLPPTTSAGPSGGSSIDAGAPPATFAPAPQGFEPPPPAFEPTGVTDVDGPVATPPAGATDDGPTDLATPAVDLADLAEAATGPSGAALAAVTATALAAAAVWIWRRLRAADELAAAHPLAGPPSLAGDSVRSAGRALVDDAAADHPTPAPAPEPAR